MGFFYRSYSGLLRQRSSSGGTFLISQLPQRATMKNVLIPTKPDDTHAIYVKLALEKKGHKGILWYTADMPGLQKNTFAISKNDITWHSAGLEFSVNDNNEFDVVWVRRPRHPVLPDAIHPADKENAANENAAFFKTFWQVISPNAFWVNPFDKTKAVNCKLQQLKVAADVGLNIPETIISNDAAKIKDFIRKQNLTIYKTLYPMIWLEDNEMRLTYTKEINIDDLPSDTMLQNTPGIFQKKIQKAFELRVNCFGETIIAAKIHSQEHPKGISDWRYIPPQELIIDEFNLPSEIALKCKEFMKKFGIVFGCFDFIVTPENEYYFLEINEQGQFLWIEDVNPNIKMLDVFCDFLISGSKEFNYKKTNDFVSISDFAAKVIDIKKSAMTIHQQPDLIY